MEDIIDKDACSEDGRNVPSNVIDDVLRFPGSLLLPLTLLRWFFINAGRLKCGLDYGLRSQFDQSLWEVLKQGEYIGPRITSAFPSLGWRLRS